jgi:peptide/nickel transport system ATP-binding protein
MTAADTLLEVRNLRVALRGAEILKGIGFTLGRERLGIVGESGSGKSMTARAILGLTPRGATVSADTLQFQEVDLRRLHRRGWATVRGRRIGMVLQDPRHALNPVRRVGWQIDEVLRLHHRLDPREAKAHSLELLRAVHIDDPRRVYGALPHELSGGMGQRAMIALMVAAEPEILIADEPTSALDLTVQRQVLDVLDEQVEERGMGLIFISHDLDLVGRFCDRVLVMRGGRVLEELPAGALGAARHPYTRALFDCVPTLTARRDRLPTLEEAAPRAGAAA